MYLMFIVWILLGGLSLWLLFAARMLLPHYPKAPQPKGWWVWDCTTFVLIALTALSVALLVFINLEPRARLLSAKEPLLLEDVNAENFYADNIVTLPGGGNIIALFDRYYYRQLQAKGQLTLPVGKLSLLVIDNTARDLLKAEWADTITSDTPLFIATEEVYSAANHIRLLAAWFTFWLIAFLLCQIKRFGNAKLFYIPGGRLYGFGQFIKECRQVVKQ